MRDRQNEYAGVRTRLVRDTRRRPLSADELLESALSRGNRRDFAERSFVRPLAHLLEACNEEADLSVFGIRALRIDVLRCLRSLAHRRTQAAEDRYRQLHLRTHEGVCARSLGKVQSRRFSCKPASEKRHDACAISSIAALPGAKAALRICSSLYSARQGLVAVRQAELANEATLYKALGGGWHPDTGSGG